MKKIWIYVLVLFAIAIILIATTTVLQYKVVDDNGKFDISASFTKSTRENIESLTENNIELGKKIDELQAKVDELEPKLESTEESLTKLTKERDNAAKLYKAYKDDDAAQMKALIAQTDKQTLEYYIPGLYDYVTKALKAAE